MPFTQAVPDSWILCSVKDIFIVRHPRKRTAVDKDDDDDHEADNKRSWRKNTVRVWGKRQAAGDASMPNRRSWVGNTIRVWGKRDGLTPEQVLDLAADRYSRAPKRSIGSRESGMTRTEKGELGRPTGESDAVDGGTLTGDDDLLATRSKRSLAYRGAGGRWVVRRAAAYRPRWVPVRGPKRSWRTNVIRVWGKRAS